MKLILINGVSCAGKSTIVKAILKQREHLFHLSYDSLKWSFSQYAPTKYKDDIHTLLFAVAETMFALHYDIICDSVIFIEPREKLIARARKHGYEIIEINLEAEYAVLMKRFEERVARAKANPELRIANLSLERWEELYALYKKDKNISAPTIRTDQSSIEDNTKQVMEYL